MKIIEKPEDLISHIDGLVEIADKYKNEIGFWTKCSLTEAVMRGRLIAAIALENDEEVPIGFLIYGGVFPNGRIQAVAVAPNHLRRGVAQSLVNSIVAKLEFDGYLSISAKPAKDLQTAQAFYQKNQFEVVRVQSGGQARKREIVVRERLLDSPNLLTQLEASTPSLLKLASMSASRMWVIDINVLFDLVKKGRTQYTMASGIFSAALEGRVRIVVTSEFSNELARSEREEKLDPLLELAKALPTILIDSGQQVSTIADEIHTAIFEVGKPSQAGTLQALSDCRHLAECVAGNASAFVTSDRVLLRNRKLIRERWGLEVAALEDFHDALSSSLLQENFRAVSGDGYHLRKTDAKTAKDFASKLGIHHLKGGFLKDHSFRDAGSYTIATDSAGEMVGILGVVTPTTIGQAYKVLLLVDHTHPRAEVVADALLSQGLDVVSMSGASLVWLEDVPGQVITRKTALQAGFVVERNRRGLLKAALGMPITPSNYSKLSDQLRLSFQDCFSSVLPKTIDGMDELFRTNAEKFSSVEKILAPTLIVSNNRRVSIQPIGRSYADELLGTSDQLNWLDQFEGSFRSQKIYVSSGRSKNFIKANQLILFYESSRTGGRGAIIAAARVDNVVTQKKGETSNAQMKRTVLDSVDRFSTSQEVTLTGFSSLLRFPRPVPLSDLRRINATGTQNLQTTTMIATKTAQDIFDLGWADGN
jgi:predicted nucleic acid-binding protein/GNAT superfamily N-acetyltransferase